MSRFFVSTESINENSIEIQGSDANHISNVLRIKQGEEITVCDSHGNDYRCVVSEIKKDLVICRILQITKSQSESNFKITLFQGIPKLDKMELIIQKCVELGIFKIVPVITEHTVVKINEKTAKKVERWRKISEAASKQCSRGIIPEISEPMPFKVALDEGKKSDGILIPYENETDRDIKTFLREYNGNSLAVFIGPEGGFSRNEIDMALKKGGTSVTLGKRILRTETAAIAVSAVIMYEKE
jgi:16S rRNA (uracil1498-N3)-methyltransferase